MTYAYDDHERSDILRMIPPDGQVIGSIGCGWGATEYALVRQGREVHGVDISPQVVERAAKRLTSARVIGTEERAPFAADSLDGLILADVIEHIPNAWDALASFAQAVKPGGWVVISVPNMQSWTVLNKLFFRGEWPEDVSGIFDRTHLQVMSLKRLTRWCENCGLRVERVFDKYDPQGPRRYRFARTCDLLTLRLFHRLFMHQVQVICRKQPEQ